MWDNQKRPRSLLVALHNYFFITLSNFLGSVHLYYRLFIYFFFFGFTPTIDIEPKEKRFFKDLSSPAPAKMHIVNDNYNSNLDKLLDNKKQSSYKNYSVMAPPTGLEPVTS